MRTALLILLLVFFSAFIIGLGFLIAFFISEDEVSPSVVTAQGVVRGVRSADGEYSSFMGIPYATVDAENPFGDALPGPMFNEVFEAHDDSARCPGTDDDGNIVGSLDCLHVNVHVPSTASVTNPLPVMVWIHGGGFNRGSSGQALFGPQFLIRHGVIFVSFNYRLGPYGFMCLDTPSVPGNTGLKDQQAALRWVKENIADFGGDSNSITVFGQSAGSMALEFQILSSGSNGLFHRAIIQSGSALVEGVVVHSGQSVPFDIIRHLGFDAESLEEALEIMKEINTDDVIRAAQDLGLVLKPCMETSFEGVNNFMITYPDLILESGQFESIPMIIGYNNHEQLGKYIPHMNDDAYFEVMHDIFYKRINASFQFGSEELLESAADIVQQFYLGNKPVSKEVIYQLSEFDSDAHFYHPIERSVSYHLAKSDIPFYQYLFAYSGGLNTISEVSQELDVGAVHGHELSYLFKQAHTPDVISPEDQLLIDRLTTMWTNFAKHGDPTPETSELLPVRWPAVTRDSRDYLYIDANLVVQQKPLHDNIAFWDLFFVTFWNYYRMVWDATVHY